MNKKLLRLLLNEAARPFASEATVSAYLDASQEAGIPLGKAVIHLKKRMRKLKQEEEAYGNTEEIEALRYWVQELLQLVNRLQLQISRLQEAGKMSERINPWRRPDPRRLEWEFDWRKLESNP